MVKVSFKLFRQLYYPSMTNISKIFYLILSNEIITVCTAYSSIFFNAEAIPTLHTMKISIASYYRQLSADIKMKNYKIRRKLSVIRCSTCFLSLAENQF